MRTGQDRALSGRRAVVIGGSGGIGRAAALSLARRGADLHITGGRSPERLAACLDAARGLGVRATGEILALDRPADILSLLPEIRSCDICVSAYGPFLRKPLHETSMEDWERLALLDLALPGAVASACLPGMAERGWGRLVFFGGSRTDLVRGYKATAAYAAAKTGLNVLVKSIAQEYAAQGIAAFLLCPGLVETEYLSPQLKEELRAKAPGGRLIDPGLIGEFAASLAAMDPCAASGAVISLDQGLSF